MMFLRSTLLLTLLASPTDAFGSIVVSTRPTTTTNNRSFVRLDAEKKDGYKFGDFTKSILGNTAKKISGNKEGYKFGDITKGVRGEAAKVVNDFTGKEAYQFGDLSRALDEKAKERAIEFTGKMDYKVGDISKEIIRRVRNGEYTFEDILLLCKILITLGAEFSPIASMLPAKFLLEMMNYSLAQEVGGKVFDVAASTLDKRFKEAVTGDAEYQVGDLTKKSIMKFIGKEKGDYELGDLSRAVSRKVNENETAGKKNTESSIGLTDGGKMDPKLIAELDQWDRALDLEDK